MASLTSSRDHFESLCDVTFSVEGHEVKASKFLIARASKVLANVMLTNNNLGKVDIGIVLVGWNCSGRHDVDEEMFNALKAVVNFAHHGYLPESPKSGDFAFWLALILISAKLQIKELQDYAEDSIDATLSKENIVETLIATEHVKTPLIDNVARQLISSSNIKDFRGYMELLEHQSVMDKIFDWMAARGHESLTKPPVEKKSRGLQISTAERVL